MPPQQTRTSDGGVTPLVFDQFAGVQTATTRPGVPDEQAYWLDGFMPLALRNLRTLPGVGNAIYTAASGKTIICFYAYNIGSVPYIALFLSDGSVVQINTANGSTATILTQNTIITPAITQMGVTQYGQQYLVVVANQTNGYWVWDGSVVYTAGTLSPNVVLTNAGAGYVAPPVVTASGGAGHGATFAATVENGIVTQVLVANPGSGYLIGDSVSLVFSGGTQAGSGGTVTVTGMTSVAGGSGGSISMFFSMVATGAGSGNVLPIPSIAAVGSGYGTLVHASFSLAGGTNPINWLSSSPPGIAVTEAGGTLTAASLVPSSSNPNGYLTGFSVIASAAVTSQAGVATIRLHTPLFFGNVGDYVFDITNSGSIPVGTTLINSVPVTTSILTLSNQLVGSGVALNDGLAINQPGDFPSAFVLDSGFFYVSAVSIVTAGAGYGPNVELVVSGGGSPQTQAVLSPIITGGSLTSVVIQSGGVYGTSAAPTIVITDSAVSAAGFVDLMPFGIQGTAVQTHSGHVWVFNGNVFNFTAPGSISDFSTSNGGGSQQSSANYLKVGYVGAVSTNGFLFILGDSSMDYISGVVTSGSVATTTFNQNNADPEIGTPYPAAITTFQENILIANATGVFLSSGGTFQKISEPMDGVYNTVPSSQFLENPFNGVQLSAAKATIFGKRVWMILVPIVDPVSGQQVNKLLMMRDKKVWWASEQDVALTFIQGQEINSEFVAWGTDGRHLYKLFDTPSLAFKKVAQTKLWDDPMGIDSVKALSRFWSLWKADSTVAAAVSLSMDGVGIDSTGAQYNNSQTYTISGPTAVGYYLSPPMAVGQQGVLNGFTLITNAADLTLIVAKVAEEVVQDRT